MREYIYAVPKGTSPFEGTITIGHTIDHVPFILVITGNSTDTIWIDGRGDYGGFYPTQKTFLELNLYWINRAINYYQNNKKISKTSELEFSEIENIYLDSHDFEVPWG